MIEALTNAGKTPRRCIIGSAILIALTVVLTLYSGSRPIGPASNISEFIDKAGAVNDRDGSSRPIASEKARPLTAQGIFQHRFEERQKLVYNACQKPTYKALRNRRGRRGFSSIARKRIKWCRIPKVGTTYLSVLEGHYFSTILSRNTDTSIVKKVMFVREPYSRLVSGYIGKIVTNQPWWRLYGASIIRKFRPRGTDKAKQCGNDVTFPEFLKYFIASQVDNFRPNPHWNPTHNLCNPCVEGYDFIGHLETFKDDLTYVLSKVNVSVDMDFSDEEQTMKAKARTIVKQKPKIIKCESMCSALRKVWWSFQARGFISNDITFPLVAERCNTINGTEFGDLAWDAHLQSMGYIDKHRQRREMMVKLYLQASLDDRMKVRMLLMKDFEMYGYDSQPPDIFPEISES